MHITKDELLAGRDKKYKQDYTQEISDNLDKLLIPINKLRDAYGIALQVNSGWRPPAINLSTPGAAPHSKHMVGLAVDINDPNGKLRDWCLQNLQMMKDLGIYMEDFRWTSVSNSGGWVHWQLGPPKSGKRIFVPSAARSQFPNVWSGQYDSQYDD